MAPKRMFYGFLTNLFVFLTTNWKKLFPLMSLMRRYTALPGNRKRERRFVRIRRRASDLPLPSVVLDNMKSL